MLRSGRIEPLQKQADKERVGSGLQKTAVAVGPVRHAERMLFRHSVQSLDHFFRRGRRYWCLVFFSLSRAGMSDDFSGGWQGGQLRADGGGNYLDDIGLHLMRC